MECQACGQQFEVPSEQYVAEFQSVGMPCKFCGEPQGFRVGIAGDDPEQFKEELAKLTTVFEVKNALEDAEAEFAKIEAELEALADPPADPEAAAKVRREHARLRAKIQALNMRWSEILAS